ncbi:MAG: hypothetical protein AAFV53_38935 [Myxococcota bacterium]
MTATTLITHERLRQIEEEGWTAEHDDEHVDGSLAKAALCYATAPHERKMITLRSWTPGIELPGRGDFTCQILEDWPWAPEWWKPGGNSPEGRRRDLVKAGALLKAEIARLRRLDSSLNDLIDHLYLQLFHVSFRLDVLL